VIVVACSGPGAMEAILAAQRHGVVSWWLASGTVAVGIVVRASLAARPWSLGSALGLALVALHPAMWDDARGGDCGRFLRDASTADAVLVSGWLLAGVAWAAVARRRAARREGPGGLRPPANLV
jgi:hypothetical protein